MELTVARRPSADFSWPQPKQWLTQLRKLHTFRALEMGLSYEQTYPGYTCYTVDLSLKWANPEHNLAALKKQGIAAFSERMSRMRSLDHDRLAEFVKHFHDRPVQNRATLHLLHKILIKTCGKQPDSNSALSHIRRASRYLHPDKTAFLSKHEIKGLVYMKEMGEGYKFMHAQQGARSQLELMLACRDLLRSPEMREALFEPSLALGCRLTARQATRDWAMLGVLVGAFKLVFGDACGLGVVFVHGVPVLALWHLYNFVAWVRKTYLSKNSRKADPCFRDWAERAAAAQREEQQNVAV